MMGLASYEVTGDKGSLINVRNAFKRHYKHLKKDYTKHLSLNERNLTLTDVDENLAEKINSDHPNSKFNLLSREEFEILKNIKIISTGGKGIFYSIQAMIENSYNTDRNEENKAKVRLNGNELIVNDIEEKYLKTLQQQFGGCRFFEI